MIYPLQMVIFQFALWVYQTVSFVGVLYPHVGCWKPTIFPRSTNIPKTMSATPFPRYGGFHSHGDTPKIWLVYFMETPRKFRMITRGTPMTFMETPILSPISRQENDSLAEWFSPDEWLKFQHISFPIRNVVPTDRDQEIVHFNSDFPWNIWNQPSYGKSLSYLKWSFFDRKLLEMSSIYRIFPWLSSVYA